MSEEKVANFRVAITLERSRDLCNYPRSFVGFTFQPEVLTSVDYGLKKQYLDLCSARTVLDCGIDER